MKGPNIKYENIKSNYEIDELKDFLKKLNTNTIKGTIKVHDISAVNKLNMMTNTAQQIKCAAKTACFLMEHLKLITPLTTICIVENV